MKVPRIPKEKIANIATGVLAEYQTMVGHPVEPPIPVEDIIERCLGLSIGFMDFDEIQDMKGVLGAMYVKDRLICANKNLLNNRFEGRLNFTWAHEAGHWVMHRKFVDNSNRSDSGSATIFCRYKDAKLPIEWQADYFASCLLMPAKAVIKAWDKTYGPDPLVLYNIKSAYSGPLCFDPCVRNWHLIADKIREAGDFTNVSKQSIIIKLQDLGLIVNKTGARMGWPKVFFQKLNSA